MKVKDIILKALKYAGREDVCAALSEVAAPEGECAEAVETMLYCFAAVEDELARFYFPLTATEKFSEITRQFRFEKFGHRPIKILKVSSGGKKINYELFTSYLKAGAVTVEIEYSYSPSKKTIDGDCDFPEESVSEKMLAAGTAAEYCLICGEMGLAEYFEKAYRREINAVARRTLSNTVFPPRRWI